MELMGGVGKRTIVVVLKLISQFHCLPWKCTYPANRWFLDKSFWLAKQNWFNIPILNVLYHAHTSLSMVHCFSSITYWKSYNICPLWMFHSEEWNTNLHSQISSKTAGLASEIVLNWQVSEIWGQCWTELH